MKVTRPRGRQFVDGDISDFALQYSQRSAYWLQD